MASDVDRSKSNVSDVPSSFIGRAEDIRAIAQRFRRGARLVTVTGPGGMGKTRTAIRFAQTQVAAYSEHGGGGVWFSDLSEARSATDIAASVASALRLELRKSVSETVVVEGVGRALARHGKIVVVLDNFEHLVAHASATVGAWIASAPDARFLVTSRVALDLPGEELWPLDSLPEDEANALFIARARQVRPGLDLSGEPEVVGEIVRRLDGMPLAIELAASRTAILSPTELRDRLAHPLELLVRRRSDARHASMRRVILDSVDLLGAAERAAFTACSIFRGGFTLDAAESVLGNGEVLSHLEALSRHSLLRAIPMPELGGEVRFSFFETIREIALELSGLSITRGELLDRHATFYARLARRLGAEAACRSGGPAYLRLGREFENIVETHALSVKKGDLRTALALALGLDPLLSARGMFRLRLRLLDEALSRAPGSGSSVVDDGEVAEALLARGLARRELGDVDPARRDFDAALAVAEAASDPALAAVAHLRIGEILDVTGSTEDARARFSKTLELLAASPEDALRVVREAETYLRIAHAFRREGALDRAELAVGEATARYRRLEHDEGLAGVLYEGAVIAMFQNRAEIALARFDEGLVIARRAGARTIAAALTTARGGLLQEMRRFDEALVHHADAAGVFRELGSRYREASALYYLGTAYLDTGDPKEADRFFAQALECGRAVGAPRYEALMQGGRAIALDMLGDCATSREAFASAERAQAACRTEGALAATLAIHRLTLGLPKDPMSRAAAEASAHALADAHPSDDSRFALRMFLGALNPETRGTPASLVVYDRGRAFRLPRARQITDLSHRVPLRAILRLLAEKRALMPGATVSVEDIICAGWPGESIDVEAAMNRVYVALAALRRLGLRELLVTGAGGYMLSPAVGIALVAEPLEALEPPS